MRTKTLGLLAAALLVVCIVAAAQPKPDETAPAKQGGQNAATPKAAAPALAAVNAAEVEAATRNRLTAHKIREALAKPADFEFKDATIDQIAETLEGKLGVPVRLDTAEFEANVQRHADQIKPLPKQISFARTNVTARSALEMMLASFDAGWQIRNEAIWITSRRAAETALSVRTYDVSDRNAEGERIFADEDALVELIQNNVAPKSWRPMEGDPQPSVRYFRAPGIDALVVLQSQSAHESIEQLLADVRAKRKAVVQTAPVSNSSATQKMPPSAPPKAVAADDKSPPSPALSQVAADREVGKRLARLLAQPADFEFKGVSLEEVASTLESKLKAPVRIDVRRLRDAGIDPDATKLSFKRANISMRAAVDITLSENELDWVVENEVMLITTRDHATTFLETRMYDISDRDAFDDPLFDDEQLIELITRTVNPASWDSVGGVGQIGEVHSSDLDVLVINQTRRNHETIDDLFAQLRGYRRAVTTTDKDRAKRRTLDESIENRAAPLAADPKRDAVVSADNQFAFDLYRSLAKDSRGNVFYSPHSVAVAMAMVKAGATGKTAEELTAALHVKGADADYLAGRASLNGAITGDRKSAGYDLKVANRLWIQKSLTPQKAFAETLRTTFGGEVGPVDFVDAPQDASKSINEWVESQTAGKIRNLIAPDNIDAFTRTVLVNAVYFKGDWLHPFEADLTKNLPFDAPSGSKQVPTMEVHDTFAYAVRDECRVLQLPYDGGKAAPRAAMLILLPRRGDEAVRDLEKKLSAEFFADTLNQLEPSDVQLQFPKFKFDKSYRLNESLTAAGIKRAFSPKDAELSSIVTVNPPLFIQQVVHRAFIDVDEKGTEAAAATAVFGGSGGIGPTPRPLVFRADHPFLFVIYDLRTKAILFLGRVDDPSAAVK